jgi:uncharacterized membrane protein
MIRQSIIAVITAIWLILPTNVLAFEPTTDCVIEDFDSQIQLNFNSSAKIEETLRVNCGTFPNKHGIFRMLPSKVNRSKGIYPYTKIQLLGISNEKNIPYTYQTINDYLNHIVTWKIGDPDTAVTGINIYKINYSIDNIVIPTGEKEALYLNLNGNFWELPTNHYSATIDFPADINTQNTDIQLYAGKFGDKAPGSFKWQWKKDNHSITVSADNLLAKTGLTVWAEFPKGLVQIYQPNFFQRYGENLWWLLFISVMLLAWQVWKRYGDDPNSKGALVVEYDPPIGLSPLEAGLLTSYGALKPTYISATIIDLAVRGYIKITEIKSSSWLSKPDWELSLIKVDISKLKQFEKQLLETLFDDLTVGTTTTISDQKNKFFMKLPVIRLSAYNGMKQYFDTRGTIWNILFWFFGFIGLMMGIFFTTLVSFTAGLAIALTGLGLIVFAIIMPKRTQAGVVALYQLRGFELYMKQAETDRMRFYEKENIFEKYLPYAIIFGITGLWIKAFSKMYAEKHPSATYASVWYIAGAGHHFELDRFTSQLNSLSTQMASTIGSSGPGGSSGGGAGGGGGGSW